MQLNKTTGTYFADNYRTARERFVKLAQQRQLTVDSLPLALAGPGQEQLVIDLAWYGPADPRHIILHSSGLHGLEGYAGSAIQLSLLDRVLSCVPDRTAVIFVHALNPFGMAWYRRVNEQNVDLNRNFLLPGEEYTGETRGYRYLDNLLNPPCPPRRSEPFLWKCLAAIFTKGYANLRQAVAVGQYERPRGLFFGGKQLQKSFHLFTAWLDRKIANLPALQSVLALDIHTGLGAKGQETLFIDKNITPSLAELLQAQACRVQVLNSDRMPYKFRGGFLPTLVARYQPLEFNGIYQEFGTTGSLRILKGLRQENQWVHFVRGTGAESSNHWTKRQLFFAFCPPDRKWRETVLVKGRRLFELLCRFVGRL